MALNSVLLEADTVSKFYASRAVVKTASLRARAGVVTGLLGRNGAGKSTLLRILVGDIAPDSGTVRHRGVSLEHARLPWLARRQVFFLPDRDLLHPQASVGRQIQWIAQENGMGSRVMTVAEQLGIVHAFNNRPHNLSGGERRRAEVLFALLRAPQVLVLDEPLRGIAPMDAEVILQAVRAFAAEGGAVVVTGHELPLLIPALDAITWCHQGTTREFATSKAALHDFAFKRDFLPTWS